MFGYDGLTAGGGAAAPMKAMQIAVSIGRNGFFIALLVLSRFQRGNDAFFDQVTNNLGSNLFSSLLSSEA